NPSLRVTLKEAPAAAPAVLEGLAGVLAVRSGAGGPGSFVLECDRAADPREEVFRAAVERGWVLLELALEAPTLEEVFVRLTTHEPPVETGGADDEGGAGAAGSESSEV